MATEDPRARAATWLAFGFTEAAVDPVTAVDVRAKSDNAYYDWTSGRVITAGPAKLATLEGA